MNRRSAGTDINPVAACIAGAKAEPPGLLETLSRVDELQSAYLEPHFGDLGEFFSRCFHEKTLKQVVYLRTHLDWQNDPIDRFIAAMALGALHGESHRSKLCFSNRMPRTISTKPDYSVRWWTSRNLVAPDRDVFSILKQLTKFRLDKGRPERSGRVVLADAREASRVHPDLAGQVRLVVTSPPYVNVTDYAEDQWLRLWFLGGEPRPKARSYMDDRHTQLNAYWAFLTEAWAGLRDLLAPNSTIVIRIGGKVGLDALSSGLSRSLTDGLAGLAVSAVGNINTTELRNRQTNAFRPGTQAGVEHDFIFEISQPKPPSSKKASKEAV
jgi:hypothetical protein